MKKSDIFKMALQNLRNRKTRTKLTVVGVVIGACSILIMVSIGMGIDRMITSQYQEDSSLQKITVYSPNNDMYVSTEKDEDKLKVTFDSSAVESFSQMEHITNAVGIYDIAQYVTINRGRYSFNGSIYAIDTTKMPSLGYTLEDGASFSSSPSPYTLYYGQSVVTNFMDSQGNEAKYKYGNDGSLSESDIDMQKDLISITPKIDESGDGESAQSEASQTAQSATVAPQKLNAIGQIKADSSVNWDIGYSCYVDEIGAKKLIEQYNKLNGKSTKMPEYSKIALVIDDISNVETVTKSLQDSGFSVESNGDGLQEAKSLLKIVQLVLGALGAISMLVAAFGISNTMVMSVYERTKEIGVMKVLGCELKDIKAMFLYEAGCIGLIGGTIGLIISYIVSIIANFIAKQVVMSQMSGELTYTICISHIPIWLAVAGIIFSICVGVVAGLSPASRAVKTSALSAIHNE